MTRPRREVLVPGAVFLAGALLHFLQGLSIQLPWLFPEELRAADGARSLVTDGRAGAPSLYALATSPLWLLGTGAAYAGAKVVGALAVGAAAFPAYSLARLVSSRRAAGLAALGAVVAPATVFASAVLPLTLAYPLGACGLLFLVRHLDRGGARDGVAALLLLILAAACWPPLLALPVAGALVAASRRVDPRSLLTWPGASVLVLLAAVAYPALLLGRGRSPTLSAGLRGWRDLPEAAIGSLGSLALGVALLPAALALAALAMRRRLEPPWPALLAVLVLALAVTALTGAIAAVALGEDGDELPLLVALPVLLATSAGMLERGRPRWTVFAPALALTGVAALAVASGTPARLPGLTLAGAIGLSSRSLALLLVAGALLWRLAPPAFPALAAAAALVLVVAAAGTLEAGLAAHRAGARHAALVPDALADGAASGRLTVLPIPTTEPALLDEVRFWNGQATVALPFLESRSVALASGLFTPPLRPRGLLLDFGGERTSGTELARTALGALTRPTIPTRARQTTEGLYSDGWSGARATYRQFGGTSRRGTVRVLVSRKLWIGEDRPGTVRLRAGPLNGVTTAERETVIHSGQETTVEVPVPRPPFQVAVSVDPTFSPSEFGQPDPRRLGAELTFTYVAS